MDVALTNGVTPIVPDYCWTPLKMDDSYARNAARGYGHHCLRRARQIVRGAGAQADGAYDLRRQLT